MGAGAELDVAVAQAGQLGDPQAGLDGQVQQGVVSPPGPGVPVGSGEQSVRLGAVQVADLGLRSQRLVGMARTRAMSPACSGWRSAA